MFNNKPKPTVKRITSVEIAARRKMSDGEIAAREYLGRKQIERDFRVEAIFLSVWACLALGALAFTAYLMLGAM